MCPMQMGGGGPLSLLTCHFHEFDVPCRMALGCGTGLQQDGDNKIFQPSLDIIILLLSSNLEVRHLNPIQYVQRE